MKEIEIVSKDTVKKVYQKQIIEKQLLGQLKPEPGHSVFEFNIDTSEVSKIVFTPNSTITFEKNGKVKNKHIDVKPNCFYITALNIKNAKKKLRKIGFIIN